MPTGSRTPFVFSLLPMSSILSLSEIDQPRIRKDGPLELYLWPNDPEHTTITTDTGLPEYQVFTKEAQLFGSGRVSSFQKFVDSEDGGIALWVRSWMHHCVLHTEIGDDQPLAQISWRNWEFQPLYVFQPAIIRCFIFQDGVRVQDFLYKRSPYSTSYVSRL